MSKKTALLISLLLILVLAVSSCNLIVKDPEVDKSTVIIEVAGQQITKEETQQAINQQLMMENYYYQMQTGQSLDMSNSEIINSITDVALDNLISSTVIKNKMAENNFTELSAEDEKTIRENAATQYQTSLDAVKKSYFSESELKDTELNDAIVAKATELGYQTEESIFENLKESKLYENFKADVVKEITVTDDEVLAEYNTRVDNARNAYETNPSLYNTHVLNNSTIYYRPSGYRNVKQILVKLLDEDTTAIAGIKEDISAKTTEISGIDSSIAALNSENEEDKAKITELEESKKALQTELDTLNASLTNSESAAYAALDTKVAEISEKIKEGADFNTLIETYNEDPGMTQSPIKENGYPVTQGLSSFDPAFVEAAMTLKNINEISEPIKGQHGYHFIQYVSDVIEGAVSLEDVKELIRKELLTDAQNTYFDDQVKIWIEAANAKIYKDRLK